MPLSLKLADATVELMGDGVAVILQDSDKGVQNVVMTLDDAKALVVALGG
jgi:hypothetical protein